ncbi:MAG: porin [Alloprevotella sp.]|nr:porin [Alloprevotella sp.]
MRHQLWLCAFLFSAYASAQSFRLNDLQLQVRGDYQREYLGSEPQRDNSGFKGQFLNFLISADLPKDLSFSFRYRLNKMNKASDFFDATDWIHLDYRPIPQLTLSAGKQVVMVGGYEYDRPPIDLYFCSEFWNQSSPYAWGASVAYTLKNGRDTFTAQFTQSPFRQSGQDTYAYHFHWTGQHGRWSTLWSYNLMEYAQGRFIHYLALGNAISLGKVRMELDLMNRAGKGQAVLLQDVSLIGEVQYRPIPQLCLSAKASYDVNKGHGDCDRWVWAGTEVSRYGGAVEYFPLKDKSLRIHADYAYSHGHNTHPDPILQPEQHYIDCGLTWYADFTKLFKKKKHNDETDQ